jgi:hypothetical protein
MDQPDRRNQRANIHLENQKLHETRQQSLKPEGDMDGSRTK